MQRPTIDTTVARALLNQKEELHQAANRLVALARADEVDLVAAPQARRLDVTGNLEKQLHQELADADIGDAPQVARVSKTTFPDDRLFLGNYHQELWQAWDFEVAD